MARSAAGAWRSATIFSPLSARLSRARGARTTVLLGILLLVVGNAAQAALSHSILLVMLATTVTASGAALAYSAIPLIIMDAVPASETASANSLNALMRMLGTSSCSAVVAALSAVLVTDVGGRVLPSAGAYTTIFGAAAGAAVVAGSVLRFAVGRTTGAPVEVFEEQRVAA